MKYTFSCDYYYVRSVKVHRWAGRLAGAPASKKMTTYDHAPTTSTTTTTATKTTAATATANLKLDGSRSSLRNGRFGRTGRYGFTFHRNWAHRP